jgi:hypothetical protein
MFTVAKRLSAITYCSLVGYIDGQGIAPFRYRSILIVNSSATTRRCFERSVAAKLYLQIGFRVDLQNGDVDRPLLEVCPDLQRRFANDVTLRILDRPQVISIQASERAGAAKTGYARRRAIPKAFRGGLEKDSPVCSCREIEAREIHKYEIIATRNH